MGGWGGWVGHTALVRATNATGIQSVAICFNMSVCVCTAYVIVFECNMCVWYAYMCVCVYVCYVYVWLLHTCVCVWSVHVDRHCKCTCACMCVTVQLFLTNHMVWTHAQKCAHTYISRYRIDVVSPIGESTHSSIWKHTQAHAHTHTHTHTHTDTYNCTFTH